MADHYSSKINNSYTNAYSSGIDPKSLYIKSIPAELSEETFLQLFSEGGKRIKKHLLYPAKPNMELTCGIISYDNETDAAAAKACLNGKSPLFLKIEFASEKKKQPSNQRAPSMHERESGRPGIAGASGRGSKTPGIGSTGPASGLNHLATVGRGRAVTSDALHNLKVHVDGDKRIAYQHSESSENPRESSNSPDFPDLIPNLCLFCKKKGDLSCGKCGQTYCSVGCQRQDWPKHKSLCKSQCTSISKQCQFANDSSYMSEGSSSDNDKKVNNNLPANRPFNRNQSGSPQSQDIISAKSRVSQTLTSKPQMPVKESASSNHGIQKKFIRADEIKKQELALNKQYKVTVCKICSPSNFWIHLDGSSKVLYQMEKEMISMVQKIPVRCAVDDVCCTVEDGKFLRVKVLELTPKTSIAEFIDYGGTSALLNDKLYFLPQVFKKYQAQALSCNLVDGVSQENISWSDEDISSFEYHTKNKVFTGHVHVIVKNVHNIALMNEEGISIYSILKASHMVELGGISQAKGPATIPSILSDLKVGTQVTLGPFRFEEDKIWGIVDNGSRTKSLKELQNCLQKVETEDISLTCEEGDLAVGFSPTLNQFYRCVILKRLRNCFQVRYIDNGNTERITQLQSLSPSLLQKKSYVICCEKPTSLSIDDFDTTHIVTVKRIINMEVELSFSYKNELIVIRCYPWYHGTDIESSMNFDSSVSFTKSSNLVEPKSDIKASQSPRTYRDSQSPRKNTDSQSPRTNRDYQPAKNNRDSQFSRTSKASQSPRTKITLDSRQLPSESETAQKSIITKNLIPDKTLDAALKYDVKITWIDAFEIYVQLTKDEGSIRNLLESINKYCNSESYSAYSPLRNEIVCCKFTDGLWYRAEVTGKNKYHYKVFFIDYGNKTEVSISDIKPLPEEFISPPKLSFCISLYGIRNEDINKELLDKLTDNIWSMELKNSKQKPVEVMLYLEGKPITEFIIKKKNHSKTLLHFQQLPSGISYVVICFLQTDKIFIHQQKDLKNLSLLQTEINSLDKINVSKPEIGLVYCCRSGDGCWYRGCVKQILSESILVNFIDYGNDEEIPMDNLKELSDELFSHPVYCVPLIVQNLEHLESNLQAVYLVEVVGKEDGIQLVKVLNPLQEDTKKPTISDLKRLSIGEGINEVKLLFCDSGVFYCHLKNSFEDIDLVCQKLMNHELKPLNSTPSEGDLVCAKSCDGYWYRAAVQKILDKEAMFKVLFIDYGNCEDVSSENIQCLSEDLLKFPVLCVPVKITNIEKAKNTIDIESVLSLKTVGCFKDKVPLVELVLPHKTILPKSNSLKKQSLLMGKEIDVSLCHALDDIFFVQMASSKELLTTLESKLLKASEFNDLSDLPEIGDLICAKFVDGKWYRGSVEKIFSDQKSCDICFIDYGNNEVISLENMKILPTSLCSFPVLSMPVKFKSREKLQEKINGGITTFLIRVIESSDTTFVVDIVVPEDDVQLFSIESEVLPESPVEVMVVHKEADVFYIQKISNAEKLQKMIIDLNDPRFLKELPRHPKIGELCNVKYEGLFCRAVIKEQCSENRFKVLFVDYGNFDFVEPQNIYCIPTNYSTMPGLCTAVKFEEAVSVELLNSYPMCTIKYSGISKDNIHIVKLYPAVSTIPISSLKQSNIDSAVQDVVILLSFDGEFHFLSKASDSSEINKMNALLEKFEGDEISRIPTVDEVLLVKCQNGSWHRGCIKAVNKTSKTIQVFLIDCGTTEELPFSAVSYMPEKLSAYPIFCIKVIVKNSLVIADSVSFGKQYCALIVEMSNNGVPIIHIFKQYMLSSLGQQRLPLNELRNIVFYHLDGDILFLQDANDAHLIAEVQIEAKKLASSDPLIHNPVVGELLCARSQADGSWYRCCVEEILSSDKCRIRFIDYGNDEIVMRENLRSFVGELAMYPSFAIPVRISDSGCAKPTVQLEQVYSVIAVSSENTVQLVKLMHQHESHIHIPSENVPMIDYSTNFETKEACLQPSKNENSVVKEVCPPISSNPDVKFLYSTSDYVDFPDGEQDIIMYHVNEEVSLFCAPFNIDAVRANVGLTSEITKFCENLKSSSYNGNSLPELDELVLAKYNADNQWYRAVIIDDSNHPFYDVIFIDYGNTERVSIDYIRKMEKDFMSLPVQAHLCSITGFTIDDKSLPGAIKEMQTFGVFVNPAPLKAFVSSNGEEKSVNIPKITKHLLEKNLVTAL